MRQPRADINVTPLIDILLVLLVIFMAVLPLNQQGIDTSLPPKADDGPRPPGATVPASIVLEYTAEGRMSINTQSVTAVDLEPRLKEIFASRHDKTLYILGAPSLRYKRIVEVMDAAKGAGISRVGIITEGMRRAAGV